MLQMFPGKVLLNCGPTIRPSSFSTQVPVRGSNSVDRANRTDIGVFMYASGLILRTNKRTSSK